MNAVIAECRRRESISLASENERQRQVLKEALEKIANLTTGESSKIACEALDTVFPIKGATP